MPESVWPKNLSSSEKDLARPKELLENLLEQAMSSDTGPYRVFQNNSNIGN